MTGDRWGVGDSEVSRDYPCDEFVASRALRAWRGVLVKAPAEAVWPWVAQVRLAPLLTLKQLAEHQHTPS